MHFTRAAGATQRRRFVVGAAFALVTVAALVLVTQRLTRSSWPLAHARVWLVAIAGCCYFASFVLRARGWRRLFPDGQRPDQARCLASVGAAAASGAVLPLRLDYVVKVGTLRRLGGRRVGLDAIALSIVSLGIVDAVAMLPLSIAASVTSSSGLRGPLLVVVAFGVCCGAVILACDHLVRLPLLCRSRHLGIAARHVSEHRTRRGRRSAAVASVYLLACWTFRVTGSVVLLSALGLAFSPAVALCALCLSAAAGVIPITAGGAVANVGATVGILLSLGVGREIAINFSLASGLLIVASASAAGLSGLVLSLSARVLRRRGAPALRPS